MKEVLPSSLQRLIKQGDTQAIRRIFEKCTLDARDPNGRTALHYQHLPSEIVKWLVQSGLDINSVDDHGLTPLASRISLEDTSELELLISLGADVELADNSGRTPLHNAALYRYIEALRVLIANDALVNTSTQFANQTPLAEALICNKASEIFNVAEICEALINAGATQTNAMRVQAQKIAALLATERPRLDSTTLSMAEFGTDKLLHLFDLDPVPTPSATPDNPDYT